MMKEGWEYRKLGEIATEMYRGSGIKRDQITNEGTPCVRYGEIYTTYNYSFEECISHTNEKLITSKKHFEYNDILFAITGESVEEIGKTIAYIGHEKCLAGSDIVVMKHKQNAKFISYVLASPNAIKQKGFGKTKLKVVHTNIPALKNIQIPVPPLSEQQKIVEYLDTQFAKIDALKNNAEQQLQAAKDLFQSALKDLMTPKEEWEKKKLGEVAKSMADGPFGSNLKAQHYTTEREVRIVQLSNIGEFGWRDENVKYTSFEHLKTISRSEVHCGDIVIAKMMPAGRAIICPNNETKYVLSSDAVKVELKNGYNPEFIMYSINSYWFNKQVLANVSGSGRIRTSLTKLRDCNLYIPDIETQKDVVDKLNMVYMKTKSLQSNYEQTLTLCNDLKQSLLKKIFE